ncbi:uncharacterized protein [Arachis hypogaea]|uniref:uncharacterized protein n=1 Tax=Arachis hypogaea TaxID=3818 RepID=UPI003B20B9F2
MVESERLLYLRLKQPNLWLGKFKQLHECMVRGETNAINTGQRIILPKSFTGGSRYMFNNCKDAFVICKYARYPSYFITMTCDPEWNEIKREVTPQGLHAEDRSDILCRIFKLKVDKLIRALKKGTFFGKIIGYCLTIEFQKRCLPHIHLLLFMHPESKQQTVDDIDKVIKKEIPDKRENPKLYAAVEKYMVHGPCGHLNSKS